MRSIVPAWAAFQRASAPFPAADAHSAAVAEALGVAAPRSPEVTVTTQWRARGLHTTELRWNVGFGPDTRAWFVRPDHGRPVPGVLALHSHGGDWSTGAAELVDGRDAASGPAAFATELALLGFGVLAHDTLAFGSRAVADDGPAEEELLSKAGALIGSSMAGAVAHDDLVALGVLAGLDGIDATRLGTFGMSGGGARALVLGALDPRLRAAVVSCMMSDPGAMVPDHVALHTWMVNPPGLVRLGWLPGLPAFDRGQRWLVQYAERDALFPLAGMRAAHCILRERSGDSGGYSGSFFDSGHELGAGMRREAGAFLAEHLSLAEHLRVSP
jgi:dienelactone hydrolase